MIADVGPILFSLVEVGLVWIRSILGRVEVVPGPGLGRFGVRWRVGPGLIRGRLGVEIPYIHNIDLVVPRLRPTESSRRETSKRREVQATSRAMILGHVLAQRQVQHHGRGGGARDVVVQRLPCEPPRVLRSAGCGAAEERVGELHRRVPLTWARGNGARRLLLAAYCKPPTADRRVWAVWPPRTVCRPLVADCWSPTAGRLLLAAYSRPRTAGDRVLHSEHWPQGAGRLLLAVHTLPSATTACRLPPPGCHWPPPAYRLLLAAGRCRLLLCFPGRLLLAVSNNAPGSMLALPAHDPAPLGAAAFVF